VRVVERAFATAQQAKARALREAAIRATFNMLDGKDVFGAPAATRPRRKPAAR